ncbi:hypothetical protein D3C81_1330290 [compost metagenome]
MARKNHIDLRFLSNSVNDAKLEQKYLDEMKEEGTAAYLVKLFYRGHNLEINMQTLNRDVSKVQETMNSGLSYKEKKKVINHMIATKCTILNFISSKRNEALTGQGTMVKVASKGNSSIKENPSFFDQDDLSIIKDELTGGRTNIKKIKPELKEKAKDIARQILIENKFASKFVSFEWAWKIGLELDQVSYNAACVDIGKETYLEYLIKNSARLEPEKLNVIKQTKLKYDDWLITQHQMFGQCNENSQ